MKTSELTGALLDFWVLRCEGRASSVPFDPEKHFLALNDLQPFAPSTNWAHGGRIIEQEKIAISFVPAGANKIGLPNLWWADTKRNAPEQHTGFINAHGETPLIAAMRCFVASKFGDEVPNA